MKIISNNLQKAVKVIDNTPVLSTDIISSLIDLEIEEIESIILARKKKFKRLGSIKILKSNSTTYFLNERHLYLLLSYLKQDYKIQKVYHEALRLFSTYKRKNEVDYESL